MLETEKEFYMSLWMIRSGSDDHVAQFFLQHHICAVGWSIPDISNISSYEEIRRLFVEKYPEEGDKTIDNWTRQMMSFKSKIAVGDCVVLPRNKSSIFTAGIVNGDYTYISSMPGNSRHTRAVEWSGVNIPRNSIRSDVLSSLGSILTVCQIKRNNAEEHIKSILSL